MAIEHGIALAKSINATATYLIKPNLHELMDLVYVHAGDHKGQVAACRRIVEQEQAQIVALTLGDRGALLTTRDGYVACTCVADRANKRGRRWRQLSSEG
jgi:6-phosphofructokinase 2